MSLFEKFFAPVIGGIADNLFAKNRQDSAQEFSAQQFATRYQTTVKDMEAAGLNPALAYQQGGGSPPAGIVSSPGNNFTQASALIGAQIAQAQAQASSATAQARKTNAEAAITEKYGFNQAEATLGQTLQNSSLSAVQTQKVMDETRRIIEDINRAPFERDKLKAAAHALTHQGNLAQAQSLSEDERKKVLQQQIQLIVQQTGLAQNQAALAGLDVAAAKSADNLGREFGQYGPIIKMILDAIRIAKR